MVHKKGTYPFRLNGLRQHFWNEVQANMHRWYTGYGDRQEFRRVRLKHVALEQTLQAQRKRHLLESEPICSIEDPI